MSEHGPNIRILHPGRNSGSPVGPGGVDSGGGGPHDPSMEARIAALETSVNDIKAVLQRLEPVITRMDERLKTLPSAESFGELKCRFASLPTRRFLLAFAVIATGLPALISKLNF